MKRLFVNLFEFYLNSSIHVSLAVVCLVLITFRRFSIPVDFDLLAFIFFATISSYNFVKYAGIAKLHHLSLAKNLRYIQIFSFLAFVGLVYYIFLQPISILIISGILGGITLLYILPVFNGNRNLRALPGIKIYVIAIVWAGVTIILPVMGENNFILRDVIIEFLQRFLFAFVLLLPFEIRDLKFDMAQLYTIPQKLGVSKTKVLGFILLGGFFLLEFFKVDTNFGYILSLTAITVILIFFIRNTKIRQGKYYSSFWVEGIPILWWGLLEFMLKVS